MAAPPRRAAAMVSAGILLSRLTGLLRERVVGHFLGLSVAADAYAAAFRIPNLLQNLLGEGVLSASFIPSQVALVDAGREQDATRLAGTVLGLLTAVAGGGALLLVLLADPVVAVLTPAKDAEFRALAADLLRLVAPGLALLVVSAWCLGVLNSHRRFFLSYVAPVVWNLAQVIVLVIAGFVLVENVLEPPETGPVLADLARWLAAGTFAGGLLQLVVQLPAVRRLQPGVRPTLGPISEEVRTVTRAFVPVVTGRGVVQLLGFLELVLASLLAGAALATLQKVQLLSLLPVSLFGMSVAAAELPELSGARSRDLAAVARRVDDGLARVAFWVAPSAVGFIVLGDVIVAGVLQSGAFDAIDTRLVWIVLAGSAIGITATTSSRLLQSVLYGAGDTRAPARIAIVRVLVGLVIGGALMLQFDRFVLDASGAVERLAGATLPAFGPLPEVVRTAPGAAHLGALGLTFGVAVGALVEFRLLRELVRVRVGLDARVGGRHRGRIAVATAAATAAALLVRPVVTGLQVQLAAVLAVGTVAIVHVAVARAVGVPEARAVMDAVRQRLRR